MMKRKFTVKKKQMAFPRRTGHGTERCPARRLVGRCFIEVRFREAQKQPDRRKCGSHAAMMSFVKNAVERTVMLIVHTKIAGRSAKARTVQIFPQRAVSKCDIVNRLSNLAT